MELVSFNCSHTEDFISSAKAEGWITDQREIEFLLMAYPDGCLVYLAAGKPAAFITAISYTRSAWIGNLLVLPAYRQRGIGRALMEKVLAGLDRSGCETVWLTASADGAHLYRTLGFVQIDRVQRWRGSGTAALRGDNTLSYSDSRSKMISRRRGLRRRGVHASTLRSRRRANEDRALIWNRNKVAVATIDCMGWGDDRRAIFEALPENCSCFRTHDGFLVYSPSGDGQQIGPWGAVSKEAATHLLATAIGKEDATGAIFLDVPEKNHAAAELLSLRGFSVSGSTLLMYRGRIPEYRAEYIYSLASMGSYG